MTPQLTVEKTMEILRTTVPLLEELARGVPDDRFYMVTDYGWSVKRAARPRPRSSSVGRPATCTATVGMRFKGPTP